VAARIFGYSYIRNQRQGSSGNNPVLIALEAASSMMVGDMTRSMGQIFPGFVLVIFMLFRLRPDALLRWLPVTIVAMIITPMFDVWANRWFPRYPVPVVLLRRLLEHV
jgi:hypothetical protein